MEEEPYFFESHKKLERKGKEMNDRTLEAHRRFCEAFGLNETENSFVKRLMEEITEHLIVNEEEREEWIEELGLEMVELLRELVDEVGLYLLYCAYEGPLESGEPTFVPGGWYEKEFEDEKRKFDSLLKDPLNQRYLHAARCEAFREGKRVSLGGIDGEFLKLVEKLKERHPFLSFEPSKEFEFSLKHGDYLVGYIFPTEKEDRLTDYLLGEAEATLLHEVGHGVLCKNRLERIERDLEGRLEELCSEDLEEVSGEEFLPLLLETEESEGWEIAWQEAELLGLSQDPEFREAFEKRREWGEESHAIAVYHKNEIRGFRIE